jgi:hypothetical protein
MARTVLFFGLILTTLAGWVLLAQRVRPDLMAPASGTWEYRTLLPPDVGRGVYQQVDAGEIQRMGDMGWELVSVVPWVLRNDERKADLGASWIVTQSYPAYVFKRKREQPR